MKEVWHSAELWSYGIAVGTVLLGVLGTVATWPLLEEMPFTLLFLAVMVSRWYGGLGPGILATLLAIVASAFFFFSPLSALFSATSEELPRIGVFTLLAMLMSLLNDARYRVVKILRESETRFQQVFDLAAVPALLLALDGRFLRVNQALCALFGYPEAALLTRTFQDLTYAADRGLTEEHFQQVLSGASLASPIEQRFVHRQGQWIWGLVSCSLLRDKAGVPLYFVAQIQDITVRKEAERAVRESEENYRLLFDSIDEGFCVIEVLCDAHDTPSDYRFLAVNPAFIRQTGILNAVGRRMRDIAPQHEDQWFTIYSEVAMTGESRRFEQHAAQL
jgi:PAS domain S-box-containing protein